MIHTLLEILAVVVGVPILLGVGGFAIFFKRLKRPILVVPGATPTPPLAWRWSYTPPAVAHRRMLMSIRSLQARVRQHSIEVGFGTQGGGNDLPATFTSLVGEIESEAIKIDAKLIAIEREDRHLKRKLVNELEPEISKLAASAGEAEGIIAGLKAIGPGTGDIDLATRLKALSEAVRELRSPD